MTQRLSFTHAAVALAIAAFLLLFLVVPVATVIYVAFTNSDGSLTLGAFRSFFHLTLMRESFYNSLYVGGMSVLIASIISLPLAYFTVRFRFRGAILIQTLGVLPLIMPPFVGAAAMQLLFGRSGSVNLLLNDWFGFGMPFMEGLNGVIFVEALHYFPFILLNLTVALPTSTARWRSRRRTSAPAAFACSAASCSRSPCRATSPAPRWCSSRCSTTSARRWCSTSPTSSPRRPICASPRSASTTRSATCQRDHGDRLDGRAVGLDLADARRATTRRCSAAAARCARRKLTPWQAVFAYGWIVLVLLLVLSPHLGILLLSFSKVWSYHGGARAVYTLRQLRHGVPRLAVHDVEHAALLRHRRRRSTCVIGTAIAYLILRTKLPGRQLLDFIATAAIAIPGVVLGIGYLRTFRGFKLPFTDEPFMAFWLIIAIAYAVRRLPYALRSCMAALQQVHVSLEEAAENLGASNAAPIYRIVVPLMAGGILAGFVTSFLTAAVEMSATIMLVSRAEPDAPMSYGIYLYMQ